MAVDGEKFEEVPMDSEGRMHGHSLELEVVLLPLLLLASCDYVVHK